MTAQTYRWKTINTWNDLPDHLRGETNLSGFKTQLRRFLLEERRDRQQVAVDLIDLDRPPESQHA